MNEGSDGLPGPPRAVGIAVRTLIRPALRYAIPHRARRAWFELLARLTRVPHEVTLCEETLGGIAAERADPPAPGIGSVLYLHGGGFVFGSPRTHRSITISLTLGSGVAVHSLDYRLAPEHPFPAALDDALASYRALRGGDPGQPVALAGDSAGGGLALALAQRARDEELPPPVAICLFCPWLDLESNGARAGHDSDHGLPRAFVERGADAYLSGHDARDPLCSPVYADLSGLPPILAHAASNDILRADAESLAERCHDCDTELHLHVIDGLWHDFHAQAGALPAADAAIAEAGEFLRTALTPPRA